MVVEGGRKAPGTESGLQAIRAFETCGKPGRPAGPQPMTPPNFAGSAGVNRLTPPGFPP